MEGKIKCGICGSDIKFTQSDIKKEVFLKSGSIIANYKTETKDGGFFSADKYRMITHQSKLLEDVISSCIVCFCGNKIWMHHAVKFDYENLIEDYSTKKLDSQIDSWGSVTNLLK